MGKLNEAPEIEVEHWLKEAAAAAARNPLCVSGGFHAFAQMHSRSADVAYGSILYRRVI